MRVFLLIGEGKAELREVGKFFLCSHWGRCGGLSRQPEAGVFGFFLEHRAKNQQHHVIPAQAGIQSERANVVTLQRHSFVVLGSGLPAYGRKFIQSEVDGPE